MTLTFDSDLRSAKINQYAKYIGQMSLSSKVVVGIQIQTDWPINEPGPLKWY